VPRKRRARGYIGELPSGSFRAVVFAGTDPLTHKLRYIRETAKTCAEVALTRLQRQVDDDAHPKSSLTVGQAVAQWLDVATLEDTTRDRYDDLVRLYVRPTFGDFLRRISTPRCWRSTTHGSSGAASCATAALTADTLTAAQPKRNTLG
jgi:hypothetical protein